MRAPDGYGKTSAIVSWAGADARRFAWARIDRRADDPTHLVALLTAAVDGVAPDREEPCTDDVSVSDLDVDQTLALLTKQIQAVAPIVVVLDSLDHQLSAASAAVIDHVVDHLPAGSQLVLAGRSARPAPLTAHRLTGEVFDLTSNDLALTDDDARRLLAGLGLRVAHEALDDLLHRAEGWPAGLVLLAQAGGDDALTVAYLDEVLAKLPEATRRFVEATSLLDVVTDAAADELLVSTSSARVIDQLINSGSVLFVPVDHTANSFRYHRLFAPALQGRLERRDPDLAATLRRRASHICERKADVGGAVRHALRAGDGARAADIVLKRAVPLVFSGQVDELGSLLGLLDESDPERWPSAAVATGWYGIGRGDAAIIARALGALTTATDAGPLADGSVSIATAVALMRSLIAPNGAPGVVRDTELVRLAGDPGRNPFWGLATSIQGTALSQLGDDDLARARFAEAHPLISHLPMFEAGILSHLAVLDLRSGDVTTAQRRATRALSVANRHHLATLAPSVPIYAVGAMLAARAQHRAEAEAAAAVTEALLDRFEPLAARTALFCHTCLADAALRLDDRTKAREHLRLASSARRRDPTAVQLNRDLDELVETFAQRNALGAGHARLTPAETKLLAFMPTHLSLAEIAEQLFISHNTAKSQSVAIYRKLGVSRRREAVAAARDLGILTSPTDAADGPF